MGRRVGIAQIEARHLIAQYHTVAQTLESYGGQLERLAIEASDLLDRPIRKIELTAVGEALLADAEDLEARLNFLERIDTLHRPEGPLGPCSASPCGTLGTNNAIAQLVDDVLNAETIDELTEILDNVMASDPFLRDGIFSNGPLPQEFRQPIATAFAIAMERGWASPALPLRFRAGVLAYGEPNQALTAEIARELLLGDDLLRFEGSINPFGLSPFDGLFGPARDRLVQDPDTSRAFVAELLNDHHHTGDTALNMHEDQTRRAEQLAQVVLAASMSGPLEERVAFVEHLVETLNADGDTNSPVYWAAWSSHAALALEDDVHTTQPTFGTHRFVPDSVQPHWEHAWNEHLSPALVEFVFHAVDTSRSSLFSPATVEAVNDTFSGASKRQRDDSRGGDPGGTYSPRATSPFIDLGDHAPPTDRGRHIITHALHDASPEGSIAGDEFTIIDHGISNDGVPTFTLNLPGVIDLATPVPGFDPVHSSVRDLDQVALRSAPTSSVHDNAYAQMVLTALEANAIPAGSNLLIIGNSFGADTALDIAASPEVRQHYNITHVVAAAYDSLPQLADIPPEVDVLVLQNSQDQAIALEQFHRWMAHGDAPVSVNTFSHEVQQFDGGLGTDLGHHPNRYIDHLNNATDPELDRFFTSLADTGYANSGATVAIDVSLDPALGLQ